MTQKELILKYLEDFGSITQYEALRDLGIMRLASRITDLRKDGVPIIRETVYSKNRYGKNIHYARYKMRKDDEK